MRLRLMADSRFTRHKKTFLVLVLAAMLIPATVFAAYHHQGESDSGKFLETYPDITGTKLDHCALCHSGGEVVKKSVTIKIGSCQWCHDTYGYHPPHGDIALTMNAYGNAFKAAGRDSEAVTFINSQDTDGDGHTNAEEIAARTFPGDAADHPGLTPAPARVYTKAQLKALGAHTQFLHMNTSRSGDFYGEYTGVPMKTLLDDAGILPAATGITVYALDAWSQTHPLNYTEGGEMYHVYGNMPDSDEQYPQGTYNYNAQADDANDGGWCDYSAPSCQGRNHGDLIAVNGGLKAILAYAREGADLDPGILNNENKLDGEGPFRLVVPQKNPSAPDQLSTSDSQEVVWPYVNEWDHNAGACTRSLTFIKVEPLPEGTTDVDVYEAGWRFVDEEKIVIYGAIDGTDSNGNGILDSEEKGTDPQSDMDGDGILDYLDTNCAQFRHTNGNARVGLFCSAGDLAQVEALRDSDGSVPQANKPAGVTFPYGVFNYKITGLTNGQTVTVTFVFPEELPANAKLYKIDVTNGWQPIDFIKDGNNQIKVSLTDGGPLDADGEADGTIIDPAAIAVSSDTSGGDSDSGSCFIMTLFK